MMMPKVERSYWPTDTWRESLPEEQGLDLNLLHKADQYIRAKFPNVQALVIIKNGYLVYERYFSKDNNPYSNIMSVTKSVTSALIGIALKENFIRHIDQSITDFLSEYVKMDSDPIIHRITIRHLLTMTSGFYFPSGGAIYRGAGMLGQRMYRSENWVRFIMDLPVKNIPGEVFEYKNVDSHLLSAILTKVTGKNALDFAHTYLFKHLGIHSNDWLSDPQGNNCGDTGLKLTAIDMAKFGFLYLNNGYWEGKLIIDSQWIQDSTTNQVGQYGFQWWISTEGYYAQGMGGQLIQILPDLDMVIVFKSGHKVRSKSPMEVSDKFIIPAVRTIS